MASQELKAFLRRVNSEGEFTSQAELGAADRADLQAFKIPQGAAGLIIAAAKGSGGSFNAFALPLPA